MGGNQQDRSVALGSKPFSGLLPRRGLRGLIPGLIAAYRTRRRSLSAGVYHSEGVCFRAYSWGEAPLSFILYPLSFILTPLSFILTPQY